MGALRWPWISGLGQGKLNMSEGDCLHQPPRGLRLAALAIKSLKELAQDVPDMTSFSNQLVREGSQRILKVNGRTLLGMVGYDSMAMAFFEALRQELNLRSLRLHQHVSVCLVCRSVSPLCSARPPVPWTRDRDDPSLIQALTEFFMPSSNLAGIPTRGCVHLAAGAGAPGVVHAVPRVRRRRGAHHRGP
jgi:hypothetical protein